MHPFLDDSVQISVFTYPEVAADLQQIRREVFQVEQAVDPALDFDGLDPVANQIVAYVDQAAVGTARIRWISPQVAKIERVAVLSAYRNRGIGRRMMQVAIDFLEQHFLQQQKAFEKNVSEITNPKITSFEMTVHAQIHVLSFYERLGFKPCGSPFYEANILHIEMRKLYPNVEET